MNLRTIKLSHIRYNIEKRQEGQDGKKERNMVLDSEVKDQIVALAKRCGIFLRNHKKPLHIKYGYGNMR